MASRREKSKKITAADVVSAVTASSGSNDSSEMQRSRKESLPVPARTENLFPATCAIGQASPIQVHRNQRSPVPRVSSPALAPTPVSRVSTPLSKTPRPREESCATPKASPIPKPRMHLLSRLLPERQVEADPSYRYPPSAATGSKDNLSLATRARRTSSTTPLGETHTQQSNCSETEESQLAVFADEVQCDDSSDEERSFRLHYESTNEESLPLEDECISDKENQCTPNKEANSASVHLWHAVCHEAGVSEDSKHAHQMVLAHMWQLQKNLCETQKESLSSFEEFKASVCNKSPRPKCKQIKASPQTAAAVHKGYSHYVERENALPWNINEDPFGGSNRALSLHIMDYVRGANPNTSHEETNAAIRVYWRNIRRKKKEESIWGKRQLDARRRKNKRDKYKRRSEAVSLLQMPEEDKVRFKAALDTLPVEVSQSTEETGEEDHPFSKGELMRVKFVRRRRWESLRFQELKKACDRLHRAKVSRSHVQSVPGAFSSRAKPNLLPENDWIIQDSD